MTSVSGRAPHGSVTSGVWHVPRSRGAVSGVILVLLGVWGGLVPFWGPQFGYAYTPATSWTFTFGRLWLEILPAAAAIVGGLVLLASANRATGLAGGWLAALGGIWFIVGPTLSGLWSGGGAIAGSPASTSTIGHSVAEIGFFYGLGAAVLLLAAMSIGRYSVVGKRETRAHTREAGDGARDADTSTITRPSPRPDAEH